MVWNQLAMRRKAMLQQYLEAGRVVGTRGVKGEPRTEPWCDSAEFLSQFRTLYWDPNGTSIVRVFSGRTHRRLLLAVPERAISATQGGTLHGRVLYLSHADVHLPKNTQFVQGLLSLTILDVDTGKEYSKLTDILKTGANDMYQVTPPERKTYLIPSISQMVLERDSEGGVVEIRPIKGIFDDEG